MRERAEGGEGTVRYKPEVNRNYRERAMMASNICWE